jgi:acyl-CoA reductase-like NAD-dependent aldehyde dehydrogenase
MQLIDNDLKSLQEARIVSETARDSFGLLTGYSQVELDGILKKVVDGVSQIIPDLLKLENSTKAIGVCEDKLELYNKFVQLYRNDIDNKPVVGPLRFNEKKQIEKMGIPLGPMAVLLPIENTVLYSAYALYMAIKSGNSLIVVPDPKMSAISEKIYPKIQQICLEAGLPQGFLSYMNNVTFNGIKELTTSSNVAVVINVGCPDYYDQIEIPSKPVLYAETGSTPVFIEKTANIDEASSKIIRSRAFDNGLTPASEQFVVAESSIANDAKEQLIQKGAYFMSPEEEAKLRKTLFRGLEVNQEYIGKNATWIANRSGFTIPDGAVVLVSEQPYIFEENPFTVKLKCPVMAFYQEPDWKRACQKCIHLLKERRSGHTLVIHSNNNEVIKEYAIQKPVGRMIVNDSVYLSSLGIGSDFPLSMFLGGQTTGRGCTAENIVAKDLTYQRAIYYCGDNSNHSTKDRTIEKEVLKKLITKILEK